MDSANLIFSACFIFSWIVFAWEFYLSLRQYRKYRDTTELPPEMRNMIDEETFHKSRSYKLDKARFAFVCDVWSQVGTTVTLLFGLLPAFWNISGNAVHSFNLSHEIWQSLAFMLITTIVSKIVNTPLKLYSTFVIEEKHGFNKQTLAFFIKDEIKGFFVGMAIGAPILAGVLWIIQWGGDYFFIILWSFLSIVIFCLMTIYPEFIAPLFDKYESLPAGELRTKIEALAGRLEFPLKKLFVVEGSKRSAHSNAYLYGLWNNKRIVLYDTILENYSPLNAAKEQKATDTPKTEEKKDETPKVEENEGEKLVANLSDDDKAADKKKTERKKLGMNDDEVVAVIGHELGHWKLSHNINNILISEVNLLLCLSVFALLYKQTVIYSAFGFATQPTLIGLTLIFEFIFAPYNEILSFLMTAFTRRMEFQADAFSAELGYAKLMQSALIKLEKDNLGFPVNDWLYSAWHHSHPPTPERIAAMKKYE